MGEVMVEFNAVNRGPFRHVTLFEKHAAGAEGNVAIGISRLGQTSGIITRIGQDEFGQFLLATLRAENVDTSHVTTEREFSDRDFLHKTRVPCSEQKFNSLLSARFGRKQTERQRR